MVGRTRTLAVLAATIAVGLSGAGIAEASQLPATMVIEEEFCAPATTCGTVTGSLGTGTNRTVINQFTPLGDGCFHDVHTTTAQFDDGALTFVVDGTLCAAPLPGTFSFSGTWAVSGGTGRFATASGGGTARAFRQGGPIHGTIVGSLG